MTDIDYSKTPLSALSFLIRRDWRNVYFGAVPYLEAMSTLDTIHDAYGCDDGASIVNYFLANAQSWRGPTAKAIKAELKRRVKGVR